jgi:hypothetical protein
MDPVNRDTASGTDFTTDCPISVLIADVRQEPRELDWGRPAVVSVSGDHHGSRHRLGDPAA